MINQQSVEAVVHALVEASSDDPQRLQALMRILVTEGQSTGLGYIITDATRAVARKLASQNQE
ncbi:MAG: hypothetical protein AAB533_03225 [Patescibacteria group bacterium]